LTQNFRKNTRYSAPTVIATFVHGKTCRFHNGGKFAIAPEDWHTSIDIGLLIKRMEPSQFIAQLEALGWLSCFCSVQEHDAAKYFSLPRSPTKKWKFVCEVLVNSQANGVIFDGKTKSTCFLAPVGLFQIRNPAINLLIN
jgi:hypothetical protein